MQSCGAVYKKRICFHGTLYSRNGYQPPVLWRGRNFWRDRCMISAPESWFARASLDSTGGMRYTEGALSYLSMNGENTEEDEI